MSEYPKTSKMMVHVEDNKPDVLQEYPVSPLKDGEMLVKVELSGICGTDLHAHAGNLGGFSIPGPHVKGHEVVARIVETNGYAKDSVGNSISKGDRIIWTHISCNECYVCKILNLQHQCEHWDTYAFAPPELLLGGLSEYEIVKPKTEFIRIPDEVTDEEALGLGCAFLTIIAAFENIGRHGGIHIGDAIVIQGVGPLGLYATLLSGQSHAAKVIAIDASDARLEFAKKWGATDTINMEEYKAASERIEVVKKLTGGIGGNVVVECSGQPAAFAEGLDMLAIGGLYAVIGQTSGRPATFNPTILLDKAATIISNRSGDIRHFYRGFNFILANRKKYDLGAIISKKYRLEEVNEAMDDCRQGRVLKAAIDLRL